MLVMSVFHAWAPRTDVSETPLDPRAGRRCVRRREHCAVTRTRSWTIAVAASRPSTVGMESGTFRRPTGRPREHRPAAPVRRSRSAAVPATVRVPGRRHVPAPDRFDAPPDLSEDEDAGEEFLFVRIGEPGPDPGVRAGRPSGARRDVRVDQPAHRASRGRSRANSKLRRADVRHRPQRGLERRAIHVVAEGPPAGSRGARLPRSGRCRAARTLERAGRSPARHCARSAGSLLHL